MSGIYTESDVRREATIENHSTSNLDTFVTATKGSHEVAGLYFYSILDCLVEVAHKVSRDFFERPHLYTDLKQPADQQAEGERTIAPTLARLNARYGCDEFFLAKSQRDAIYRALFGGWDDESGNEQGDFPRLRDELTDACGAFAERVFDTGVEMLRERVRTTHRPFAEYLAGLTGDSLHWSRDSALPALTENTSYAILRNPGVAGVFGITTAPRTEWPYVDDSNADKLAAEISKQLKCPEPSEEAETPGDSRLHITREKLSNLQRAALRGAEALATIIDFKENANNADLNLLITKCYTWGSALKGIQATSAGTARERLGPRPSRTREAYVS